MRWIQKGFAETTETARAYHSVPVRVAGWVGLGVEPAVHRCRVVGGWCGGCRRSLPRCYVRLLADCWSRLRCAISTSVRHFLSFTASPPAASVSTMTTASKYVMKCVIWLLYHNQGWLGSRVVSMLDSGTGWVQIAAASLLGNSLRQTVHIHHASVHQAAKLVAALLRVARVTPGLAESNGSVPPGLWLTSYPGLLPRTGITSGNLCSVIDYELTLRF